MEEPELTERQMKLQLLHEQLGKFETLRRLTALQQQTGGNFEQCLDCLFTQTQEQQ